MSSIDHVTFEGFRHDGVWNWNIKQNLLRPQIYDQNSIMSGRPSFWNKTAEFGKRFFAGTIGSAIPVGAAALAAYYYSDMGVNYLAATLATVGSGFLSAFVTLNPLQSLNRGAELGSVVILTFALNTNEFRNRFSSFIDSAKNVTTTAMSKFFDDYIRVPVCGNSTTGM